MTHEQILAKIDQVVGPPEDETPAEHERRVAWVARQSEARRIRKTA